LTAGGSEAVITLDPTVEWVVSLNAVATPEASTLVMIGMGLASMGWLAKQALAAVLIQPAFGGDDNRTGETEARDSV